MSARRGIQAYKFVLPTGNDAGEPEPRTHEGYDWVFVVPHRNTPKQVPAE